MKKQPALRRAHNEGSLRKRSDGRWEVRITIPSTDGQAIKRKSYYCKTKQEAVKILRGQEDPHWNLGPRGSPQICVKSLLDQWLKQKELTIKASTLEHYKSLIRAHLKPLFRIRLYSLSLPYIDAFYRANLHAGVSNGTLIAFHKVFSQALSYAVKEGILLTNPSFGADLPAKPIHTSNAFTRSQQLKLIAGSETIPHGICIRLALCTGLRIGEIVALQWDDINLSERVLKVRHTQGRQHEELLSPKTKNSSRAIPLTQKIADDLSAWHQRVSPTSPYDPVFPDGHGKHLPASKLRREYKNVLESQNLPQFTFHALRHTFATRALEVGMDFKTLSIILGHSSVSFTLDVYVHCTDAHKRREMRRMDYTYQEPLEEALSNRYEKYRQQVESCPDVMTKEQFRIACHISKRKAKLLLDNGIVPCEITTLKTWKYRIKKSDVLHYLESSRIAPRQTPPVHF